MISHGVEISIAGGGADEKDVALRGKWVSLYTQIRKCGILAGDWLEKASWLRLIH